MLLILAFLAAGTGVWFATKSAAEQEVRERVALEMRALQQEIRSEGMPAAIAAIHSRIESPGALEYRLTNGAGALLVGNLPIENPALGWSTLRLREASDAGEAGEEEDETEDFLTFTEATPDGGMLTIGDDLDKAEGVRAIVLRALAWVAAPTLLVVIGLGVFLALGSARRMRALSRVMDQVGDGNLAARAPEGGGDEIARIGQAINEMLTHIDMLVANIRRVSTDIAHDLRTPLTHVRQDLETAAHAADTATTREGIRAAQTRIDDILRVFQAILRLAEIDAGGARARFGRVDLAAVVERVTDAYRPDIEAAGDILVVDSLERVEINGDRDLIAQALANLLENAMRHTPAGTSIRVGLRKAAGSVGFVVEDHGAGIPQAERARVLEPFVRLDHSRSTSGAGLGLSIVNAIARLHGARLLLEDAEPGLRVAMEWPV